MADELGPPAKANHPRLQAQGSASVLPSTVPRRQDLPGFLRMVRDQEHKIGSKGVQILTFRHSSAAGRASSNSSEGSAIEPEQTCFYLLNPGSSRITLPCGSEVCKVKNGRWLDLALQDAPGVGVAWPWDLGRST